jgi:propanol-preferring alcohol dehydrogenase
MIFAPAGELVISALRALKRGGTVALGGIHMSPIPQMDYNLLYHERVVRSVANNTRADGEDFLKIAAAIPIHTELREFALDQANEALRALKNDAIRGAAVLKL